MAKKPLAPPTSAVPRKDDDEIPAHIDDPHGTLKKYAPKSTIGKMWAYMDDEDGEKRSAADRAADGIMGDEISKALTTILAERNAKMEAEIAAATTPEAMERSRQALWARFKKEGMLDDEGHLKPASEMPPAPATGPERFINPAQGGRGIGGGGDKKD